MKRILIIEDEEVLLESLGLLIQLNGYFPLLAQSGESGLKYLNEDEIDLVLCDINLQDMNGLEILKSTKSNGKLKSVPFLILSALSDTDDIKAGYSHHADLYLTKPVSSQYLLDTIKQFI